MIKYIRKLVGKKVYLAPYTTDDETVEHLTRWVNDLRVTDGLGVSGWLQSVKSEKEWCEKAASGVSGDGRYFLIIDKESGRPIGTVSLFDINQINRQATLGIAIGEETKRGQGLGVEAIQLICDYGFNYLNLHSVKLECLATNEQAYKAYLKAGFKETGRLRDSQYLNGKFVDDIVMDILEHEFREQFGDVIQNKFL